MAWEGGVLTLLRLFWEVPVSAFARTSSVYKPSSRDISCLLRRWKLYQMNLVLSVFPVLQKDDPDDCPIELSKVQSVKVVAKKRRDRSLPRAFEIFTDSKTYVFKAKDEKNAEEWLQCINVAVAQARERESREATTYL